MIFTRPNPAAGHPTPETDWPKLFRELAVTATAPFIRDFYAAGMVSGDTPVERVRFVALDFETTGLNAREHSIVSIGLVPFTLDRIRCRDSAHWLVQPRRRIDPGSIRFHGITHSALENAPDVAQIMEDLLGAMAGRVAVVHFRGIERPFLNQALWTRFGEGLDFPLVDTMELEARIHRRPVSPLRWLFSRQRASIRLADSRARYNLPRYSAHHALTDALATAELFQAQVAHRFSPDTPISAVWH